MGLNKRLISSSGIGDVVYSSWDISGLSVSTNIDAESEGYLSPSSDAGLAFTINPAGNRIAIWGSTENLDYGFGDVSTSWDISTISNYVLQDTSNVNYRIPYEVRWSSDGNNFYVNHTQFSSYAGILRQWELSTPFDSAAYGGQIRSFTTGHYRAGGFYMSKDGTKMILSEQHRSGGTTSYIYTYSLSTAYNISTATQTSNFTLDTTNYGNYGCWFDVNEDFGQIYVSDGRGYLRYHTISNLEVNTMSRNSSYDLNYSSTFAAAARFRISPDSTKVILQNGNNLRLFT